MAPLDALGRLNAQHAADMAALNAPPQAPGGVAPVMPAAGGVPAAPAAMPAAPAAVPVAGAPVAAPTFAPSPTLPPVGVSPGDPRVNAPRFTLPPPSPPAPPTLPSAVYDDRGRAQVFQPFVALEAAQRQAYSQMAEQLRSWAAQGAKWGNVTDPYGPGYAPAAPSSAAALPYFDPNAMQMPAGAAPLPWLTQQGLPTWR
jgi:hypothetical protein